MLAIFILAIYSFISPPPRFLLVRDDADFNHYNYLSQYILISLMEELLWCIQISGAATIPHFRGLLAFHDGWQSFSTGRHRPSANSELIHNTVPMIAITSNDYWLLGACQFSDYRSRARYFRCGDIASPIIVSFRATFRYSIEVNRCRWEQRRIYIAGLVGAKCY